MGIATSTDIVRLQNAINNVSIATTMMIATTGTLLDEMRKVDEHNVSDTAHMDLRDFIKLLLPTWYSDGGYTGPVAVKRNEDLVLGIEFLDQEDMEELLSEG